MLKKQNNNKLMFSFHSYCSNVFYHVSHSELVVSLVWCIIVHISCIYAIQVFPKSEKQSVKGRAGEAPPPAAVYQNTALCSINVSAHV